MSTVFSLFLAEEAAVPDGSVGAILTQAVHMAREAVGGHKEGPPTRLGTKDRRKRLSEESRDYSRGAELQPLEAGLD